MPSSPYFCMVVHLALTEAVHVPSFPCSQMFHFRLFKFHHYSKEEAECFRTLVKGWQ